MKGTVIEMKLISIKEGLMERSGCGGVAVSKTRILQNGAREFRDPREKATGTHSLLGARSGPGENILSFKKIRE